MYKFVGRVDQQVKIRGFRVELGEVEAQLSKLRGVAGCAVVLRRERAGEPALVAFWVAAAEGSAVLEEELRGKLRGVLPEYMVPARFEELERLPLTLNQKVDRKFLTETDLSEVLQRCGRVARGVRPHSAGAGESRLIDEVRRIAAGVLQKDAGAMEVDRPLTELGFDSIRFT